MSHLLLQEAQKMQAELKSWRQSLHQIPELGLHLPQTVAFVTQKLKEMGIRYQVHEDCSCITALIGTGEKCFLLRSDMDALPMEEESGEEIFAGAHAAIEAGVLDTPKVDAAFAMHVASIMTNNLIIYGSYPMASVYGFKVTLTGQGTHGSTPDLGIAPINTGVHIYLALQELISREISPTAEAALTLGHFEAGSASNVIPERAVLEGTLRTFKPEIRSRLIKRIQEIIHSVSSTYRTRAEIEVLSDVPPVACPEELNQEILGSIHSLDSSIKALPIYHVMGSEDFAFFTERIPASYFCIGAGIEDKTKWLGQHNPRVRFNEDCLPLGVAIYAKAAIDWLAAHTKD